MNGAGSIGYTGPCPPNGTHCYLFKVYALDTELDLGAGATKEVVVSAWRDTSSLKAVCWAHTKEGSLASQPQDIGQAKSEI